MAFIEPKVAGESQSEKRCLRQRLSKIQRGLAEQMDIHLSQETIRRLLEGIRSSATQAALRAEAILVDKTYEKGLPVSDGEIENIAQPFLKLPICPRNKGCNF